MNQQSEILDTKQLLEFIKPISERIYWSVIAKLIQIQNKPIGFNRLGEKKEPIGS